MRIQTGFKGLLGLLLLATTVSAPPLSAAAPGFFRVGQAEDGRWWFIDPQGKPFFSRGVNQVTPDGDREAGTGKQPYRIARLRRHATLDSWAKSAGDRLESWGFNTLGSWSDTRPFGKRFASTPIVGCRAKFQFKTGHQGSGVRLRKLGMEDLFEPGFVTAAEEAARESTAGRVEDPSILGYFLDNEMNWGHDYRAPRHAFHYYFRMDAKAPGKQALIALLRERYQGRIAALNEAWNEEYASFEELASEDKVEGATRKRPDFQADQSAFLSLLAQRYFSVCSAAVRKQDPNHLLMGVRLISNFTQPEVLKAAADTQDVISVNFYQFTWLSWRLINLIRNPNSISEKNWLESFHVLSGKPLLISEFGSRAFKFKTPGTFPPLIFPVERTQKIRAAKIDAYIRRSFAAPYIIGYHFYEWTDQPFLGRQADLENSNWGLVNLKDEPYERLVDVFREFHREIDAAAGAAKIADPAGAIGPSGVR